jgi:hypothetical protein
MANQTTSFFFVSGFGSGAYSAKLLNGTKQRLSGFSQPRQCGEEVLRMLVTGGPPVRGGGGESGPPIASLSEFRKHCEMYPDWGAEANRLATVNARAADKLKGRDRSNQTHCKRGHSLADAFIHISSEGWVMRNCRTCHEARRDRIQPLPASKLRQVESMLLDGKPIAEITGQTLRGVKRPVIVNSVLFYNARKADPAFDLFVKERTADSNHKAQKLRWALHRARAATAERREQANAYQRILGMLPNYLSGREDIAHDIFVAMHEKSLRPEDVPARVKWSIKDHERRFPTKYAKFGNDPLVSLDEVMFDGGTATRGDTVSRGLWD